MSKSTISTFKLFELFHDEPTARDYLEGLLWPNGAVCPTCQSAERLTPRKDGFYRCNACQLDFTIRTGTVFERSHVPLHKWLYSMYLLPTARKGISSFQLGKEIGVTQKTAWFILGRLREACSGIDLGKLAGIAEVDEYVPEVLDKMTDLVLTYRPKAKAKKARKRKKAPGRKRVEN